MTALELAALLQERENSPSSLIGPARRLSPHSRSILYPGRAACVAGVRNTLRTSLSEGTARWQAMTWLFGVPVPRCS
ncbi:hypothetical protein BCR34DRAFT_638239 [Clohesyomyces aquaticus]|uniref:Uncharacterized protein n=1 Tax=Clohesyomyces aquaticus TaxID=1231657 RepID=A0A1Y1YQH2_9PLEO|nr:hypothetical protein BCR34DRAFT_638239 [Clohesyomyces aquaticus]